MAKENLTLKVYQGLKEKLINLQYPPGSFIREREVAESFGISRTPVREAFQRLHHEGWLLIGEGKKIQVRPVTTSDIEEIFEIRFLVENYAFRWLLDNGEPRVIAGQADSILNAMGQNPSDQLEFTKLDLQFHSTVIGCSGYGRIYRFWATIHEEAIRLGFMAMQGSDRFSEVLKEHSSIVERLWNKDKEGVLKALNIHLDNTRSALVSKLKCENSKNKVILPLKLGGLP
ncbi:MAG TPA: GntR family transcriptional regulator [Synergistales bacterium]|nr:GntR family transcriptional regulator [Synergistota bacterium]HOI82514.1 GntR family transcriptional regulator [Synergistales bacterium]